MFPQNTKNRQYAKYNSRKIFVLHGRSFLVLVTVLCAREKREETPRLIIRKAQATTTITPKKTSLENNFTSFEFRIFWPALNVTGIHLSNRCITHKPIAEHAILETSIIVLLSKARGGGTWVQFCWVCAAGLSEPLPHYSALWPVIDPILVTF